MEDFCSDSISKVIEYAADEISINYHRVISDNYPRVLQEFLQAVCFFNDDKGKFLAKSLANKLLMRQESTDPLLLPHLATILPSINISSTESIVKLITPRNDMLFLKCSIYMTKHIERLGLIRGVNNVTNYNIFPLRLDSKPKYVFFDSTCIFVIFKNFEFPHQDSKLTILPKLKNTEIEKNYQYNVAEIYQNIFKYEEITRMGMFDIYLYMSIR